ncbi:ABC transporter permease subunit [Leisingera sp. HS039]|uniref:ABC transporter permease n=1 Tax=unclassified Leisingera TaxID=2614906 RepID=UPI0010710649|nr:MULTISPECIES: ABC transporter permease subunit [unclassified Leisingera]MBQ4825475.1 ABC transporter permease subunit [Leisingera sp. HS039]QBR37621.1 ABC transporter permease subunit [Leisingera sp. NJS201]
MTDQTMVLSGRPQTWTRARTGWALFALAFVLAAGNAVLPAGLVRPPEWLVLPFADWINAIFNFLRDDLGLIYLTRAFADGVEWLLDVTANLLYGKNRWPRVGPIPWTVIASIGFVIGYALQGWRLSLLTGGTFVWIAVMGQWKWAMETLSVIVVAAPFSILFGLVMGVLAWRSKSFERILNPILNIAQSLPHFAYMIPVVVFIGVGPKAGAIVTIIFSVPPMIRMSLLGLRKVPHEVIESGHMCGSTRWQLLRHVRIPTARTEILVGVNQVIMQCLAMVVLASFIGMPGLGQKLLQLLQALKIGRSVEIGITIVLLAVMLDRCTKAWATKQPEHFEKGISFAVRNKFLLIAAGLSLACILLAQFIPVMDQIGRRDAFTISKPIDAVADWFIVLIDPVTQWLRWFLITWVLIPIRDAFLWMPYAAVLALLAAAGWAIGGLRSALVCVAFFGLIAMSGWWDRAMITVYTVVVAVSIATVLGFPLGIWGSFHEKRAALALLICDTLQTFPSFIYLIPVVMLFGVNDVAVIGAVVLFAAVPLVRYTIEGLRQVPETLIEAADMAGATRMQTLWKVRLPMALPTIMVGVNQSVMFSLFMVIIAAFIGTQDLGQEMQRALSSTDVGKGLVLGLAVAFMGLMVDHLVTTWAKTKKDALGLE